MKNKNSGRGSFYEGTVSYGTDDNNPYEPGTREHRMWELGHKQVQKVIDRRNKSRYDDDES